MKTYSSLSLARTDIQPRYDLQKQEDTISPAETDDFQLKLQSAVWVLRTHEPQPYLLKYIWQTTGN